LTFRRLQSLTGWIYNLTTYTMDCVLRKMITISELAELLSVTDRTVYQWANNGEIPAYKVGNSWRFVEEEVAEWLKKKRNIPDASVQSADAPPARAPEQKDWNVKVRECAERVNAFLHSQDEKVWVIDNIAIALNEDIILVKAAAKDLVRTEKCEIGEQFIAGKIRDTLKLKKGR